MNLIQIVRSKKLSTPEATYGTLSFNGALVGFTVEQPWNNNIKDMSCFPEGHYQLLAHDSPKHPNSVAFHNPALNVYAEPNMLPSGVVGRTDCLIHPANFAQELEGCVAVGQDYLYNTKHIPIGVSNSKETITRLQRYWGDRKNLEAEVIWV